MQRAVLIKKRRLQSPEPRMWAEEKIQIWLNFQPLKAQRDFNHRVVKHGREKSVSQEWSCNLDHSELTLQFHCKLVSCSGASINNQSFCSEGLRRTFPEHRLHYAGFSLFAEQENLLATLIQFASSTARSSRAGKMRWKESRRVVRTKLSERYRRQSRQVPCKGQRMLENMKLSGDHHSDEHSRLN